MLQAQTIDLNRKVTPQSGGDDPKTRTGLVIGTVQYMAPEQLRKDLAVGPPADLYATGIYSTRSYVVAPIRRFTG